MNLQRVLEFARSVLRRSIQPGDYVVDGTVGNGHDTLFLANLVGNTGKVLGFDIQKEAIDETTRKLNEHRLIDHVTLFHTGHENMAEKIPSADQPKITGAIFNLGYLPRGDKSIVTKPNTTISAVEQLITMMPAGGVIILVVYHGHEEGKFERNALLDYASNLNQEKVHVLQYGFINQKNHPPFVLAIEKR